MTGTIPVNPLSGGKVIIRIVILFRIKFLSKQFGNLWVHRVDPAQVGGVVPGRVVLLLAVVRVFQCPREGGHAPLKRFQ
jgi:hypothetical protein